jgi:electron transport complex protein RnfG
MENKNLFKEYIKPILALTIICLVVTAAVSLTYQVTKPIIDEALNAASNAARKEVLPVAETFEKVELSEEVLTQYGITEMYCANDNLGFAVTVSSKGYSSTPITLMVGIDSNNTVSGISVIEHSETEGIGTKAFASDYISLYYGKDNVSDVNVITGATRSSTAVKDAVSKALKIVEFVSLGGGAQ